ncbi:hypothetical protein Tco_0127680 [Tanacetum coccineum]
MASGAEGRAKLVTKTSVVVDNGVSGMRLGIDDLCVGFGLDARGVTIFCTIRLQTLASPSGRTHDRLWRVSYLFHVVMLPYQVSDVPLTWSVAVLLFSSRCDGFDSFLTSSLIIFSRFTLASFFARLFKMTNFAVKHSIMTREMVENFCNNYYFPDEVHPVALGQDKTITQFPEGKVGVYTSARTADVSVYTAAAIVTSARENVGVTPTLDVAGSSQLETSEGSDDSFYELPTLNSAEAKHWYVPRWNITNESLLDDSFSCRTLVDRVAPPGFFFTLRISGAGSRFVLSRMVALRRMTWGRIHQTGKIIYWRQEAGEGEKAETAGVVRLRD